MRLESDVESKRGVSLYHYFNVTEKQGVDLKKIIMGP